jgi:hypothetical protein
MGFLLYEIMSETFWSQFSWWMVIYRARKCRSVFHHSFVISGGGMIVIETPVPLFFDMH